MTSDTRLDISVVIATWRRSVDLARCLAAVDAQPLPAAEVVVVVRRDDVEARTALESAVLKTVLRVVVVDAPGVVAALNAGLDAASGAIVAITDDDAAPRADWLERIHQHFSACPDVGAVGGRDWLHPRVEQEEDDQAVVGRLRRSGRLVGHHHLGCGPAREVDVLKGVNLAVRRDALGAIRLDERLRGTGAQAHWELALCLALRRAGWRLIYDPAVAVDHYPAERLSAERREHPPPAALSHEVHNELYALLRWLPWPAKATGLAYGVMVGSRRAPGVLIAIERCLRGDTAGLWGRTSAAQRGAAGRGANGLPGPVTISPRERAHRARNVCRRSASR